MIDIIVSSIDVISDKVPFLCVAFCQKWLQKGLKLVVLCSSLLTPAVTGPSFLVLDGLETGIMFISTFFYVKFFPSKVVKFFPIKVLLYWYSVRSCAPIPNL